MTEASIASLKRRKSKSFTKRVALPRGYQNLCIISVTFFDWDLITNIRQI